MWLRPRGRNEAFSNSRSRSSTQYALSSEEHHEQPTDSNHRISCRAEEHTKHIVVGRTTLAPSECTNRHGKVAGYTYWTICKYRELQVSNKSYEHVPERFINVNGTAIVCDVPVIRVRKIG
jgi:hypothetical protein